MLPSALNVTHKAGDFTLEVFAHRVLGGEPLVGVRPWFRHRQVCAPLGGGSELRPSPSGQFLGMCSRFGLEDLLQLVRRSQLWRCCLKKGKDLGGCAEPMGECGRYVAIAREETGLLCRETTDTQGGDKQSLNAYRAYHR